MVGRYPSLGMQGGGGVVVANWGLGGSTPLVYHRFVIDNPCFLSHNLKFFGKHPTPLGERFLAPAFLHTYLITLWCSGEQTRRSGVVRAPKKFLRLSLLTQHSVPETHLYSSGVRSHTSLCASTLYQQIP